jgi:hypothetical protein
VGGFTGFQDFVIVSLERGTGILPVFAYHPTGETSIVFGMVLLAFSVFKNMTHFTIVL